MRSMESGGYSDIENAALRARCAKVFQPAGWSGKLIAVAALALLVFGLWHLGFSATRFFSGLSSLGKLIVLMFPPEWGTTTTLMRFLKSLGETVAIALLGTLLAAAIALPLSLIAARNTTVSQILRFFTRRGFDALRGVDTLVWALVWVNVVGLGPFAGVMAIAISDIGSLGKLFSEAIEASAAVAGVTMAEVDWFIPHQANQRILEGVARRVGIPEEKVISTVALHANTSAASIPLALNHGIEDGRIKPGQLLLLEAMGGGLTWGACVLRL